VAGRRAAVAQPGAGCGGELLSSAENLKDAEKQRQQRQQWTLEPDRSGRVLSSVACLSCSFKACAASLLCAALQRSRQAISPLRPSQTKRLRTMHSLP
jgi:hypothetical protein